jgi:2'-5' RNA ligase
VSVSRRLFVALDPPDALRRLLVRAAAALRAAAGRAADQVRWTEPPGLHLTLQFLGDVPEERLDPVLSAVQGAAAGGRPLSLEVHGAGGFPSPRRPRVVWLGLGGDLEPLAALVADLGRRLAPLGFPPEGRPFAPHLTVGRARDPRGARGLGAALVEAAGAPGLAWRAAELTLFQSHLGPGGARHEPLLRARLGPSPDAGP